MASAAETTILDVLLPTRVHEEVGHQLGVLVLSVVQPKFPSH
jgi:hypothetical protein